MFILTIWLASCGIDSIFSAISDKVLEKALRKSYLVQKIRKMSLFRHGCSGISLKALLENPELQNPPSLNAGMHAVEYISRGKKVVYIVVLLVTSNWPLRLLKKKCSCTNGVTLNKNKTQNICWLILTFCVWMGPILPSGVLQTLLHVWCTVEATSYQR